MSSGECPHGEPYGSGFACPVCVSGEEPESDIRISPVFAARWHGMCGSDDCYGAIEPNDECRYVVFEGERILFHRTCAEVLSR